VCEKPEILVGKFITPNKPNDAMRKLNESTLGVGSKKFTLKSPHITIIEDILYNLHKTSSSWFKKYGTSPVNLCIWMLTAQISKSFSFTNDCKPISWNNKSCKIKIETPPCLNRDLQKDEPSI
jgi:hypothetical protein